MQTLRSKFLLLSQTPELTIEAAKTYCLAQQAKWTDDNNQPLPPATIIDAYYQYDGGWLVEVYTIQADTTNHWSVWIDGARGLYGEC